MQHTNTDTGVVMLDLKGLIVEIQERELLTHPQVGGVILFSRNYASAAQLEDLIASIKR
jgi:beta-N-acetylhexosaminidase